MKKRILKMIVLALIVSSILTGCAESKIGTVVNKIENGDKLYFEIMIEVTDSEYIGMDIGDEYVLKN